MSDAELIARLENLAAYLADNRHLTHSATILKAIAALQAEPSEEPVEMVTPYISQEHFDRVFPNTSPKAEPVPMTDVLLEVSAERQRQDGKWGGHAHDDTHPTADFVQLIEDYAGWARTMAKMNSPEKAERRLIQVAALAVAAVESSRRKIEAHHGIKPKGE